MGVPASCSLRIQDPDGNELPTGEIGEIYLRQDDGVETFEYVGAEMPPATPDGYRTFGDLGWVDADGYLYIADRRVDLIVSGGANVYPAEVEGRALGASGGRRRGGDRAPRPGVGPPRARHRRGRRRCAGAVRRRARRAHCKERLASYKVPKSFEIVERVPRTAAGKVNRSALVAEHEPREV